MHRAEVWQDSLLVAAVESNDEEQVAREIMSYAFKYAEEGPVTVRFPSVSVKVMKRIIGVELP